MQVEGWQEVFVVGVDCICCIGLIEECSGFWQEIVWLMWISWVVFGYFCEGGDIVISGFCVNIMQIEVIVDRLIVGEFLVVVELGVEVGGFFLYGVFVVVIDIVDYVVLMQWYLVINLKIFVKVWVGSDKWFISQ